MEIDVIRRKLLVKYPLFGSVIANSNFVASLSTKTACTDGKTIYYNPNFMSSFTDREQTFIIAHEVSHIAFNHIYRSEGKNKKIWNIAVDAVTNANLVQDGLPLIKGAVDIPEAINYDAEEMYQKLLEEQAKKQQSNNGQGRENKDSQQNQGNQSLEPNQQSFNDNSDSSTSSDEAGKEDEDCNDEVGHDEHSMWEEVIEKKYQKEKELSEQEQSSNKDRETLLDKLKRIFSKKKKDKEQNEFSKENEQETQTKEPDHLAKVGEKNVFKQNRVERDKQLEELQNSLENKTHNYGNDTNGEIRTITNIGITAPLIDWRVLLKEAVKYDIDWSYLNAGIEDGVVTAYLEEFPRSETEIVLDTSDSIDEVLLRNFLRECKNILQTSKVKVGCFDTKFYGFTEIKEVSDIDKLPFCGGGGTNFDVAVNAFTRRVENKIIFTDGDAPMPNKNVDAIWIVFGDKKINPPGGRVIQIDDEQLERLCHCEISNEPKGRVR